MTTLRKANVKCPECGHGFTVRDNGGMTNDEAFAPMDRAFGKLNRLKRAAMSELDLVTLMRGAAGGDDWPWMATCLVKGANEIERLRSLVESQADDIVRILKQTSK